MVQFLCPYMTTGKTIALTRWTFVGKVMSLFFNILSRLVIAFLPRSKHLLISWLQWFWSPKSKVCHCFCCFPSIWHKVMKQDAMILVFWMFSFTPAFSLSFTFNMRLFSSSSLSAIRVILSAYLRLLLFLLALLIPACISSRQAFFMMYSEYKWNKQGENIPSWCVPLLIWNSLFHVWFQLLLLYVHTSFSGGRWRGLVFPSLEEFSTVCCDLHIQRLDVVNEAEVSVFLEFCCFFYVPVDVGSLISGSSTFSKSSLCIWKFLLHILLKASLKNFEHYFASVWNVCTCVVVWTFFGIALLWDWNEDQPFQSCGHCWVFQIWLYIKCSTLIT